MGKLIYKCKVNGVVGKVGKAFAMCSKSGIGDRCAAHGNVKCKHKIKPSGGDKP